MGTNRDFQAMLNEYLPNELLREELLKRDWFLSNAEKDDTWAGGNLVVPFQGARASSVQFGGLTAVGDISKSKYIRGGIPTQPEVWGSLLFEHKDLEQHGAISEQNLLKLLPDEIDSFVEYVRMCLSLAFTNGSHLAKFTGDGQVGGTFTTDDPERFQVGQKLYVKDDDSAASVPCYVSAIDMETGIVTVENARGSGVAVDLSAYTVAQNAKAYFDGALGQPLTCLKQSLISAAHGGSTSLYGQVKTAYPYLQAINVDGTGVAANNLLSTLFDAWTKIRKRGKGNPSKCIMAYKHFGTVLKQLEGTKGPFNVVPGSQKVSVYGWSEVEIMGVAGKFTLVAIPEMDQDWIGFMDMKAVKVYSNGFIKKRKGPDGNEWFTIRSTDGYKYVVDCAFAGDMVLERPSTCGVLYGVPNY